MGFFPHFKARKNDTKNMVQSMIHIHSGVITEVQNFLTNISLQDFLILYGPLK